MSQLIETIKILNGRVYNIKYHNRRCNKSRLDLFGVKTQINLRPFIRVPQTFKRGLVKCRISYAEAIIKVEYEPYKLKTIKSLQCVHSNHLDYSHKYSDRKILSELYQQRQQSDDILIIRDGLLTDSYYANVALAKNNKWYTPKLPLLEGTMRHQLLEKGLIKEKTINLNDLNKFDQISLFNALIPFKSISLDTSSINL